MEKIKEFITEINKTNSSLGKQKVLNGFVSEKIIEKVLTYTFSPFLQFNVSSKNIQKYNKNKGYDQQSYNVYKDIFKLLDDLNSRVITGHSALKSVCEYIKCVSDEEKDIIYRIIDKNLKIRLNASTINKVYKKNIIPVFDVMLAKEYDPHFNKLDNDWFISQKLDGVRCLIKVCVKSKTVKAFSRSGKELYNLENVLKEIPISKFNENVFLDGEIVCIEKDGKENFKGAIEIVRKSVSKLENTDNLYFKIFDIIKEDSFYKCKGDILFSERYKQLCSIFKKNKKIKIVDQISYTPEKLKELQQNVFELGWEGLMLKNNKNYVGKRTRNLVKLKKFHDEEFKVVDIVTGPFRYVSKDTGLEATMECLLSIIIDVGGVKCNCGSGFSHDERIEYCLFPGKIMGKMVTIKYFEKLDSGSLRFPIFKAIKADL